MWTRLGQYWYAVRSSYWFVPTVMAVGAILLSILTTEVDVRLRDAWINDIEWLHPNTPDGARALLSAIAGSMITVAGVTFSITIAAVAYAASTLGARLLSNFMRDVANQVTLGTFIADFIYCVLILRTVHSDGGAEFVPQIGVLVALALTLASIGVLIYFIHHLPLSIQTFEVTAQIGGELIERLEKLFPARVGLPAPPGDQREEEEAESLARAGTMVAATENGYLQHISGDWLMRAAVECDLVIMVVPRPGDFVYRGDAIAYVHGDRIDDRLCRRVGRGFFIGRQRTQEQDILFLVQQLVEVAARALSPGVNNPFTAVSCIDWLGSGLRKMAERDVPARHRRDQNRRVRVIAPTVDFARFAATACDQLVPYVSTDRNAALHMMDMLTCAVAGTDDPARRKILLGHAKALNIACRSALRQESERQAVLARLSAVQAAAVERRADSALSDAP